MMRNGARAIAPESGKCNTEALFFGVRVERSARVVELSDVQTVKDSGRSELGTRVG